jgi:hypothetical protein
MDVKEVGWDGMRLDSSGSVGKMAGFMNIAMNLWDP